MYFNYKKEPILRTTRRKLLYGIFLGLICQALTTTLNGLSENFESAIEFKSLKSPQKNSSEVITTVGLHESPQQNFKFTSRNSTKVHYSTNQRRRKRQISEMFQSSLEPSLNGTSSIFPFINSIFGGVRKDQIPQLAETAHKLKLSTAKAVKATKNIEHVNPDEDFWTQVMEKAVIILHYAFGVNKREAKTRINESIEYTKEMVDELAQIKYKVDQSQKIMTSHLEDLTLKVIKATMGENEAKAASDVMDLKKNLEIVRHNLKSFSSRL